MNKYITERDSKIAVDIADTIKHFRQDCGCFPTIDSMKRAIKDEINVRNFDNAAYAEMMVQDILVINEEWFDKECEPE